MRMFASPHKHTFMCTVFIFNKSLALAFKFSIKILGVHIYITYFLVKSMILQK
ncbi:hypothetical protein CI610_03721 [invertebrate metagenome]|uniref:Uncharacterized protein n=1 Tax=invertebrate metagenome TaxID=1711999 RepID=A0A2H9T2B5_9ZZZZ